MRRDIQVNTQIGDIVLSDRNSMETYPFEWVDETDTEIRGKVTIPSTIDVLQLYTTGVKIEIPYTPVYKPVKIRVIRNFGGGTERTILNPVNHDWWHDLQTKLYHGSNERLKASQLLMVSTGGYVLQLGENEGNAYLWSDADSDLNNVRANIQNRNLLLRCIPSNSYRYPTSGVGLIRYLHSTLSQSDLADRLQSEFKADKVSIKNASFDSYTGDLDLDLDFSEADASV